MKVIITIRQLNGARLPHLSTDFKAERDDTPNVSRYGIKIVRAIEEAMGGRDA